VERKQTCRVIPAIAVTPVRTSALMTSLISRVRQKLGCQISFQGVYADIGLPAIAPSEFAAGAVCLQAFYNDPVGATLWNRSITTCSTLVRRLGVDEPCGVPTLFTNNRDRLP